MVRFSDEIQKIVPHPFFRTRDVMNLLGGSKDRRYSIIKRAIAAGEILHIRRGLYALASRPHLPSLNPLALAQHVYGPSYISLETALRHHDWIPEGVFAVTSVSMKKSVRFDTPVGTFTYDRVPQDVFFAEVERLSTPDMPGVLMAHPLKALVDYIYVYKKDWTDLRPIRESLRIEPEDWTGITAERIEALCENYRQRRIKRFLTGIKKDLRL